MNSGPISNGNGTASAPIIEHVHRVETPDGPMSVLDKRPEGGGDSPTIVIFHDGPGIRDATHVFSGMLARTGYRVLVPDLYHRQGDMLGFGPDAVAADPSLRERIWELLATLTDDGIQSDLDAALTVVDPQPPRMACLGFCLGARAVFRTMHRLPDRFPVGAMWHPSFLVDDQPDSPHVTADSLPGSLYIGFGGADTVMTVESMAPFIEAVQSRPGSTIIDIHPGAEHGFTWPDSPNHDADAAAASLQQTLRLLRESL